MDRIVTVKEKQTSCDNHKSKKSWVHHIEPSMLNFTEDYDLI